MAAATTLVLTAAQGDDRTVTGAGTTNVENIGLYADGAVMSLAGVASATVNIAVDSSVTLDSADNLGAAGPGRVTTIASAAILTAAGSVVDGQYITSNQATAAGTNATLVVDDENDTNSTTILVDTPITADLSNVSVEYISLVTSALVGTITWPALTGNPVDKYVDDSATVALNDPNANVFVQTVTLTAAQASGQVIVGATPGVTGEVAVTDLGSGLTDLSLIDAGRMIANVPLTATLAAGTNLGNFDVSLTNGVALTLTAAQADGRDIYDLTAGSTTTSVTVTALEATPAADLSKVVVSELLSEADELASLDLTNGDVTFTGNLGAGFTVTVTDGDAPADSTLTFAGSMNSAQTSFDLADNVTLVLDAAAANGLTVTDDTTNSGAANTTVIVNNLGAAQVDFRGIDGNTLIANVASDVTLNTASIIDSGVNGVADITAGYTGVTVSTTDGTATTPEQAAFTLAAMTPGESVTINGLTVAADPNAASATFTAAQVASVFGGATVAGLTLSGVSGTPTGWIGSATVSVAGSVVTFSNTVPGNVANFTTWTGSIQTTNNFKVVLADGVDLGLTTTQLLNIDEGDIMGTAGGAAETLIVSNWNGESVQSDELGADVVISQLVVAAGDVFVTNNVTADPAADFTRVQEIVIPQYATLTITADQYQQLLGNGSNVTVSGAGTLNIVGFDDEASISNAAIDLSKVTAQAGSISLSTDAIVIVDPAAKLDNASGQKFAILFNADAATQSLTLGSETQADGRTITGVNANDNQVVLGFTNADAGDANAIIETGGYSNLDRLYVINRFIENEYGVAVPVGPTGNFEYFLNDLNSNTVVVITDVDTILSSNLSTPTYLTDLTFRSVRVERETSVTSDLAFSDLNPAQEVRTLVLTLEGNSIINGNIALPQNKDPQVLLAASNQLPNLLESLTINSRNVLTNGVDAGPATAQNRINGNITADSVAGTTDSTVESFTYTITAPVGGVVGSEEQLSFDGVVINLANTQTANSIAAALAAAVNANAAGRYTATVAGSAITFTNRDVGNAPDITVAPKATGTLATALPTQFTMTQNNPGNAALNGVISGYTQGAFVGQENNLFNVTINADHDLTINGTIEMRYVARSLTTNDPTVTATLTITGNEDVTINSVNTNDGDIAGLLINHTGIGVVTIPGASPAAAVETDETLTIRTNGTLTLGTPADASKPGVAGAALSSLIVEDVPGATLNGARSVNLGVIADVDSALFAMNTAGFGGTVTAIMTDDLNTGGSWSFTGADLNGGAAGGQNLNLTFRGDIGLVDGMDIGDEALPASGASLSLTNVNLTIEGQISFADLGTLTLVNTTIVIAAGATLTLTCDQANGLDISGAGTLILVGDVDNGMDFDGLDVANIDMSQIVNTDGSPVLDSDVTVTMNLSAFSRDFNIIGSNFNDAITTNAGNDTLSGGLGNDTLSSGAGSDSISGGAGDDSLNGGTGTDTINGDAGNDTILGADNTDLIDGGADSDTLSLTANYAPVDDVNLEGVENVILAGNALVVNLANQAGEAFNVTVTGVGSNITTADGNDTITGGTGNDTVDAGAGNDSIIGAGGVDSLVAGAGNDTIVGAEDDALLDGGADADVLEIGADFNDASDAQIVNIETVNLTAGGLTVVLDAQGTTPGNTEGLVINGFDNYAPVTGVVTNGDVVTPESVAFTLTGITAGQDVTINGLTVTATADATGAQLADAFRGVTVAGLTRTGTSATPTNWTGAAIVGGTAGTDVLTFTNTDNGDIADVTLVSSSQGSTITGGDDNDTINGGNWADSLTGGNGADSVMAGAGNDTIVGVQDDALLDGGTGTDTLQVTGPFDDVSNAQIANVENVSLTTGGVFSFDAQSEGLNIAASAASAITGGTGADTITGSGADDSINGGAGADSISAGAGDDTVVGAQDDALLDGGADADVLQIGANFNDTTDAQIANFEAVNLTAAGLNVSLDAQVEGLAINAFANYAPVTGTVTTEGTAGSPEVVSLTLSGITAGQSVTINGLTVTATATATEAELADAFRGATVAGLTRTGTSGTPAGWTGAAIVGGTGADLTFTNTVNGDVAPNVTLTSTTVGSTIAGGLGADTITGSNGNDILVGAANDASLIGGAGSDVLQVGANFTAGADGQIQTIETVTLTADGLALTLTGQAEGFAINGFATGASTIVGAQGNDSIQGGSGNDSLAGGAGVDSINGGAGNDTIVLTGTDTGAETLEGGANTDTLQVTADLTINAAAVVSGFEVISLVGDGTDLTIAAAELADNAIATVTGNTTGVAVETVTFAGTALADSINLSGITTVTDATLVVNAGAEDDAIVGSAFGDIIDGGAGQDNITGGQGNDTLTGGLAVDTFVFIADGVAETDTITDWGNGGNNDALSGALGAGDRLNVTMSAWVAPGVVGAPANADASAGGNGSVTFAANYTVGDVITITLNAGAPNTDDVVVSRTVQAGKTSGVDVALSFKDVFDSIALNANDADLIDGAGSSSVLAGVGGAAVLYINNDSEGNSAFTVDTAIVQAGGYVFDALGTSGSGIAAVNGVVNVTGSGGKDTIIGGVNDDTITGALGADNMQGGAGNDTFVIAGTADVAAGEVINGSTGTADAISVTADTDFTLATISNIDVVTLASDVDATFTGAQITGQTWAVNGVAAGATENLIVNAAVGATVTLANVTATDVAVTLNGSTGAENLTGTAGADTITGGTGNDTITGNGGADSLDGGANDDTFIFATAAQLAAATVAGSAGTDTIEVTGTTLVNTDFANKTGLEAISFSGTNAHSVTMGGNTNTAFAAGVTITANVAAASLLVAGALSTVAITATGTNNNDTLTGGTANDVLNGGGGVDQLTGGVGNDTITGGAGADVAAGDAGDDVFVYAALSDLFSGNALVDSVTGGADADTIRVDADGFTIAVADSFARANTVETLAAGSATANVISVTLNANAFTAGIRTVTLAADTTSGGNNVIDASAALAGQNLNLTGSAGVDVITGGAGIDTITGGQGVDILTGGLGADIFVVGSLAEGGDTIGDYSVAQGDVLDLSGLPFDGTGSLVIDTAGAGGSNIDSNVAVFYYTADNTLTTAGAVDAMLIAQNGAIGTYHANSSIVLTDDGTHTYVWFDGHRDILGESSGVTLIATLVGVTDASTVLLDLVA